MTDIWFFRGQDFAVRTVSMETVQFVFVNNIILHMETIRRSYKDWNFSEISKIDGEDEHF